MSSDPIGSRRTVFERRLSVSFAASFLTVGLFQPFFPVWLAHEGLDAAQIGFILAAQTALRILVSPAVLRGADRAADRANVLLAFAAGSAVAAILLGLAEGFAAILLATLVLAALWAPVVPLTDAIALSGVRRLSVDYGRSRVWGSLAFIATNVVGGIVVNGFGAGWFVPMLATSFVAAALMTLLAPRVGRPRNATPPAIGQSAEPFPPVHGLAERRRSFRPEADISRLLPILVGIGLIQSSHALYYAFGAIRWTGLGYSATAIGIFWAVGVLAETVLFRFASSFVARLSVRGLLAAAGFSAALRWTLFPLDLGFGGFFVLQLLHAFSFGATHLALQSLIAGTVEEGRLGTVQGVAFSLQTVLMAVATFFAGSAYDAFGAAAFLVMAAMATAGLVLGYLSAGRLPQPQRAGLGGETVDDS